MSAFWGTVIAAIISAVGAITAEIVKWRLQRKRKLKPGPQTEAQVRQTLGRLRWWHAFIIVLMLASLTSLAYLIWLPGPENRWFVRIHAASIVTAALSGVLILILTSPPLKEKP